MEHASTDEQTGHTAEDLEELNNNGIIYHSSPITRRDSTELPISIPDQATTLYVDSKDGVRMVKLRKPSPYLNKVN